MNQNKIITLVQHYLKEQGFSLSLQALQEESQIDFVDHAVPSGELISILTEHFESRMTLSMANLSIRSREQRSDDDQLQVPGDRRIPNALERAVADVHTGNILTVRASPTQDVLVTGGTDRTVRVVEISSGRVMRTLYHHKAGVLGVEFNPVQPNLLLTCGMDGSHYLLDLNLADDAIVASWKDHTKYVVRVRWSSNGRYFATSSYDHSACLYGPNDSQAFTLLKRFQFNGTVEAITFSPDSSYLVMGVRDDNYLHYVRLSDFSVSKFNMNANKDDFVSFTAIEIAFSPNGKYLLVATDKSRLILFRTLTDDQVQNFYGIDNNEFSQPRVAWHPSGKYFYVVSQERRICAFEIATRAVIYTLEGHTNVVRDIYYDAQRDCLWSCSYDSTVKMWTMDELLAV